MTAAIADDERVRLVADEILSRSQYARWRSVGEQGWLADVGSSIGALLEWLVGFPTREPALSWTLEVALLLVAAVLLAHVAWSIRAALNASAATERQAPPAPRPDWLREAERAASSGRFLEAAHTLQLATLDELLRTDRLQLGRSEPNRVLRQRLQGAPLDEALRNRLVLLVDRLETSWFRAGAADAALYQDWRTLFAAVRGRA
jgi:hypothetical protein